MDWRKQSHRIDKVNVMSGSRFWARDRAQRQELEQANEALTATDCCDRCGARAYVRVVLPSDLELLFCAHHNREHAAALTKIAVEIHDETKRLAGIAT